MVALKAGPHGLFAVPYANGRALKPVKLPDGALVEEATEEQIRRAISRRSVLVNLGIDGEGHALTDADRGQGKGGVIFLSVHHEFFLLPSGRVAAVYGGKFLEI